MAIGKSSIEKRVAKATEETATAEVVAETKAAVKTAAPKTAAKKPAAKSSSTAKKSSSTTAKAAATKKPAAPKVDTGVLANVSPETVEKVTGHKENSKVEITQIGGKMPTHLL